jgi:acetoacetyl-CoA reductase
MAHVAIVTGGTRGIGEAISIALRDEGVTVAANYAGNEEKAREFSERTGIKSYKWDVSDLDACLAGVQQVESELGTVDILVNNAGITRDGTMKRMTRQSWDEVIDVNLGGCFNMAKAVWDGMSGRKYGRIVNIGSINGQAASTARSIMPPPSRGIHGFTKALAQEGAARRNHRQRDRAGLYRHRDGRRRSADVLEKIVAKIPVGRSAMPTRSPAASPSSARKKAGFVTGSTLSINGGQHMY